MVVIMDAIARAMGLIISSLYQATANYGLAIILFTIFIKLLTVPLTLKQQNSMKQTQEIQPILEGMQKKYANDQEKLAAEMQKLYKERNVNPFAGCLLMLIQIPIIYSMFFAIAQPVKFMYPEIGIESIVYTIDGVEKNTTVNEYIKEKYGSQGTYMELYYLINERKDLINTSFLGLDLGQVPNVANLNMWATWIIPLLSGVATFLSSFVSLKQTKKASNGASNAQAESMQKSMMYFMPIMIVFISFKVPLGMALYWLVNTVISVLLQIWMTSKLYGDKKVEIAGYIKGE